jgi:glycosyltransferase involved in cell wall biosynthesis
MVVHANYPVGETRVQRQALALVDAGFEVDVICLRGAEEPKSEIVEGVNVRRLPVRRRRGSGMVPQLFEYLLFFMMVFALFSGRHMYRRYDSVQVHNLPDFLVFAVAAAKLTKTPVILDLHDLMPEFMAHRIDGELDHALVRLVALQERLACGFADVVITVTDEWRDVLRSRGVTGDKIHVVMNVADSRLFHRGSDKSPEAHPFTVIYHGTFTHRYGVDLLVEAVHQLRPVIPELRLVLLGDGEARGELIELTHSLGLSDVVEFSDGTIEASALPGRILAADVGVVPNRSNVFTEGILPTKLLEYVAVGVPAVVAETGGVRRYFDEGMVEFFAPGDASDLAQALKRLHDDPERRAEVVRNSDAFNSSYPWSRIAAEYVGLISNAGPGSQVSGASPTSA